MNVQKTFLGRMVCSLGMMAMMILLSKDMTVYAQEAVSNPVHHCTKANDTSDYTTWSYVTFGSYPQSEVKDTATTAAIDNAIAQAGLNDTGKGVDVTVGVTKYRRISKKAVADSSKFGNKTYRYFKWEPIWWKVLSTNGSTMLVAADKILDAEKYNEGTVGAWNNSNIKSWLNGTFLNSAFHEAEAQAILNQSATRGQVFLLSKKDVCNESYGFCSKESVYSYTRRLHVSNYAQVRGAYSSIGSLYEGNGDWWLGNYSDASGYSTGIVKSYGYTTSAWCDNTDVGVVPAMYISSNSTSWTVVQKPDEIKREEEKNKETVSNATPEKKGSIVKDKTSNGEYKVTDSNKKKPTVAYVAPSNKKKKAISIPNYINYKGVKYKVTSVQAKAFKGNKKVTSIKIASEITTIGDSAFEGCTKLKTVTIGKGLKKIGKNAFKNCKKLNKITIKSTKLKTVGKNALKGIHKRAKIKVPSKKVSAYKKVFRKKGQKSTVKIVK